ncbi:hypothetical protein [Sinosporangium siamense]|uniref:Uncharacterized protein n=1 Tax=Sinosporangium siamense TaxID=1367973 RepID=A0A919RLI7_9ACTN|nr:hypothetical protein [Sinosporangium siamense]GII95045.1 hypothetical protein Ssi02_52760 [Sinosporangium siamense]
MKRVRRTPSMERSTHLDRETPAYAASLSQAEANWAGSGEDVVGTLRGSAWLITSPQTPAAHLYRTLGWREAGPLAPDVYPGLPLSVFARESPSV